jgi:hypothetical protein
MLVGSTYKSKADRVFLPGRSDSVLTISAKTPYNHKSKPTQGSHRHYRNQSLRRVPEALDEALKTLGKGFAECYTRQRLCRVLHSAKKARQTVHRQSLLCRVLFLGHSANLFAECQRALGKEKRPLRRRVTETAALPSVPCDTRQRRYLCRVSSRQHSTKSPPERVLMSGSLPSASDITLGKEPKPVPRSVLFAECYDPDTRQSDQYIPFLFVFCIPSTQT